MSNPFFSHGPFASCLLDPEICERLYVVALHQLANAQTGEASPDNLFASDLRIARTYLGNGAMLPPPAHLQSVFSGVTQAVYKTIRELYLSRPPRSARRVHQLLAAMAIAANMPPVSYEAVWAITVNLWVTRRNAQAITTQTTADRWWCGSVEFNSNSYRAPVILVAIIDVGTAQVLAARFSEVNKQSWAYQLALYDALILRRQPAVDGNHGLRWSLPTCIDVTGSLPESVQAILTQLHIPITLLNQAPPSSWVHMCTDWLPNVQQYPLTVLSHLLNTYLASVLRLPGPLTARKKAEKRFRYSHGYRRDPIWQNPPLLKLLPLHTAYLDAGYVHFNGLHYGDALLTCWPDGEIKVRVSEKTQKRLWVFADGEFLTEARLGYRNKSRS